jgi:hypothetical protein
MMPSAAGTLAVQSAQLVGWPCTMWMLCAAWRLAADGCRRQLGIWPRTTRSRYERRSARAGVRSGRSMTEVDDGDVRYRSKARRTGARS